MRALLRLFAVLLLCSGALRAAEGLADVLKARALLGNGTWSSILHIARSKADSLAPASFHALAFEFNRVLWLYVPSEGTQNLSKVIGRTAHDKLQLASLAAQVYPLTKEVRIVSDPGEVQPVTGSPRNGCFIESLAAWELERQRTGKAPKAALFSYYWRTRSRIKGHTVLLLERDQTQLVIDQSRPRRVEIAVPHTLSSDEKAIASLIDPRVEIVETRTLRLENVG